MGKYLDKNWKDLDRLLKLVITQLLFLTPISLYYRTELLMSTNLIAGELIRVNKTLSSNFKLSSNLVGNVADKFIILLIIVCFITAFSSIYSALTIDQFVVSAWNMILNIIFGIAAVIIPISSNEIIYESETISLICFIVLLTSLIPYILFRLFGYLITFVFFNGRMHEDMDDASEEELLDESEDSGNNEDEVEEVDDYFDGDILEEEFQNDIKVNNSKNTKHKKKKDKNKTSFYEELNETPLEESNRVSIFKR